MQISIIWIYLLTYLFAIISKDLMYDVNIHIFSFNFRCNIMFINWSNKLLDAIQIGKHSLVQYMIY